MVEVPVREHDPHHAAARLGRRPDPLQMSGVVGPGIDHPGGPAREIGVGPRQRERARVVGPYSFDPFGKPVPMRDRNHNEPV